MTAFTFAYIPDPGKKQIHVGYSASLDARMRARQKPVSPLMTVIAVADADRYLSQKHDREVVLNGEAAALPVYEHNNAQWYRRSDLDALVIAEKISVEVVEERKEKAAPVYEKFEPLPVPPVYESAVEAGFSTNGDWFPVDEPHSTVADLPTASSAERLAKFLPPDRTETPVTPAALLYHALTKYNVIRREVPDDVVKVEEAMQYMTAVQKEILELYYVKRKVSWQIENRFKITQQVYRRERKAAEAIVRAVIDGTYQPAVVEEVIQETKEEKTKTKKTKPTGALEDRVKDASETDQTFITAIDTAWNYLSISEQRLIDAVYRRGITNAKEIMIAIGINDPSNYYKKKRHAEGIIREVANGTYQPPAEKAEEKTQAGEKRKGRVAEEEAIKSQESEESGERINREPTTAKPLPNSKKRRDLLERLAAYRALHGNEEEELVPEQEGERLYYATQESKTVASLEDALQKSHAQATQIKKLRGKSLPDDFARIITGDVTIDFLIRDQCYAVAAAYAHDVYACACEGMVWPISDQEMQKEEKENPRNKKERIRKKEQEVREAFIAAYSTYAANPSEDGLLRLFKENLRLSRGYIATVGWYFAVKDKDDPQRKNNGEGDQWKYKPTWKDAWTFFVPNNDPSKKKRKERNGIPVLLTDFGITACLAEEEIEKILRRRYVQLWYHAETARGQLVTKYDAYIKNYAEKFDWTKMPLDDRISLGKEGFLRASEKYDPTSRNTFATYARHWMKAMISREWRANSPIYVTSNMWEKIFKIQKEMSDIRETHPSIGEEALYARVEERRGFSRQTIINALQAHADHERVLSLDDKVPSDNKGKEGKHFHDYIPDAGAAHVDETAAGSKEAKDLQRLLQQLPERQRRVLEERYFGDQGEGKTLTAIGKEIGLSRERIRQIERDALIALRKHIEKEREEKAAEAAEEESCDETHYSGENLIITSPPQFPLLRAYRQSSSPAMDLLQEPQRVNGHAHLRKKIL